MWQSRTFGMLQRMQPPEPSPSRITDEEDVFAEALKGNLNVDELIKVLDRFGCRKVPNQKNARDLILEVAHKEMI